MKKHTRKPATPEQKAAAEARRERFRQLWRAVKAMPDTTRAEFTQKLGAVATCEGRALSLNNTLLLMLQLPNVSIVGGFQQWREQGRCVRKGARGLMLWIPTGTRSKGTSASDAPELTSGDSGEGEDGQRFVMGTVFDISQTRDINEPETDNLLPAPTPEPLALPWSLEVEAEVIA